MAIKSTSISLTTTPQLIVGSTAVQGSGTATLIDLQRASDGDPVQVTLSFSGTTPCFLQGGNAALGAAPTVFSMSTNPSNLSAVLNFTFYTQSDALWAGTTAAGGTLFVIGTRQQSA